MERPFPLMGDLVTDLRDFATNPQQRIPFGIPTLDLITEGPAPGEVFTIMARSGIGKSIMATNIMAHNHDKAIVFFSLEMPARQALQRLYATWAQVDHRDVLAMTADNRLPNHLDAMAEALEKQLIIDTGDLSLNGMSETLGAYSEYFEEPPQAVIIDYLELIDGGKSRGEGWVRIEASASALKNWAKQHNMRVFLLHQTKTTGSPPWRAPTDNDAKGAGYTESDVVVGMWQPGTDPELMIPERMRLDGEIHLNVLKNRVTGRKTHHPIRTLLRDDLRLVDLTMVEAKA